MSIFGTIMSKVFGSAHAATPTAAAAAPSAAPVADASGAGSSAAAAPSTAGAAPAPTGGQTVDVAAVLDGMESHAGQTLNWRESIVDLMKLLDMDSSLTARKELAHELSYTGSTDDSATMNMWLHKEVMSKFAANGGKLPDDLKHA